MMDRATREAIGRLAEEIARIDRRTRTQGRAHRVPQLAHSSLEEGQSLEVRGPGGVRQRMGWLPDGTVGMVTEGGDPVSAPSAPTVVPSLGGLRVTWDGQLANELALPGDFDHMAVHVSTSPGFEPSAATHVGTIRRAGEGGMLPVIPLPYVEHYVRLVPVTTGGITGAPSAEVAATPVQVDGPDLTAGSIEAVHLAAGAVTADKLEAILVLASRIVGGTPGAARVEIDQGGLRGYDEAGALVFAIDSAGNAVFTGSITGSEISGSRMTLGDPDGSGNYGIIAEADNGVITNQVVSASTAEAQMAAGDAHAELSAWGSDAADSPAAGLIARPVGAELTMYSDVGAAWGAPYASMAAAAAEASSVWQSPTGARMRIFARENDAALFASPEASTTGEPGVDVDGALYAYRPSSGRPMMSVQSPVVNTGPGAGMRAMLHLAGTTSTEDYSRAEIRARRVVVGPEWDQINQLFTDEPGVLFLQSTHSIASERHAPVRQEMLAAPGMGTSGSWVQFSAAEFPAFEFTTSWSGRTRFTITAAGHNGNSAASSIALSAVIDGGGATYPVDWPRAWYVGGASGTHSASQVFYMNLAGNTTYTVTPHWRISSGGPATAEFNIAHENSIVVEPLM